MTRQTVAAIIVAAGKGTRARGDATPTQAKQYQSIAGKPMLAHAIAALLASTQVDHVIAVIASGAEEDYRRCVQAPDARLLEPVHGGATRQSSVLAGLKALAPMQPEIVLIHDAARPLLTSDVIANVIDALETADGALPCVPVTDTIKRSPDGIAITGTEDRRTLFAAQTPQGFRFAALLDAHARAAATVETEFTDDAAVAEWAGMRVVLTPGHSRNIKVTHPEDFARAERLLRGVTMTETRIGTGYDVHPFEPGGGVWLGGVHIPFDRKLQGHSDADVALHAITDAVFGALGEGDIGHHFPPSDPQWKGADSRLFLRHAAELVTARAGRIVNIDVTIVCEQPKVNPHVPAMRAAIAETCGIAPTRVAIKATTSEKLGFIGREEGIVAMASASVELPRQD
jgi:2-C-methyl-D-erythritol 4-phosphate cytidylyltransferase/2-C-methyl-D-erythritol 2,4-cyclodiphosphate synthase